MTDLFDFLRCDFPLPDSKYQVAEFQTKDLARELNRYVITQDGRLMAAERSFGLLSQEPLPGGKTRSKDGSLERISRFKRNPGDELCDLEFHGDIRFYLTNDKSEWVEYVARFTHGCLERIERREASDDAVKQIDLAGLADAVELAEWAYGNVVDACFNALRSIDNELAMIALDALGDERRAARWLGTRNRLLSGLYPYQVAAVGQRQEVLAALNRIQHGIPG